MLQKLPTKSKQPTAKQYLCKINIDISEAISICSEDNFNLIGVNRNKNNTV
jgi:hypothetical protein